MHYSLDIIVDAKSIEDAEKKARYKIDTEGLELELVVDDAPEYSVSPMPKKGKK
jgi:hypothetical protein